MRAICVGIGRYHHLTSLTCATRDAKDVAAVLKSGFIASDIRVLLDAAATKEAILKQLAWLANTSGPGHTAVIFFSGHGGRSKAGDKRAYFCPVEASLLDMEHSCLSSNEFAAALAEIKSERLLVLLDTCYSGGIGDIRQHITLSLDTLTSRDVDALIHGRGRTILAASRPDEPAWELNGMRNGLFSTYLLRGLRGEVARDDGTIWASDIFSYVSRCVSKHQRQHVYQKSVGEDFVIMVQSRAETGLLAVQGPQGSGINQRSLRLAIHRSYNRAEISLLCSDLGLSLEDLPGTTLEGQIMELIDHCHRHGIHGQLLHRLREDRPQFFLGPTEAP
jgi:hypothetical protein